MMMHIQTWDNGKYGRIWAVGDGNHSRKFTEVVNGCATDEQHEKSAIIASHFVGYCIDNELEGEGDIYTPFFSRYYQERLEKFRHQHLKDISLIRNPKELEKRFLAAHIEEERRMFEASQTLFEFDKSRKDNYTMLFLGYMDFLQEKTPLYFVFKEISIPQVFPWREFDKIATMGCEVTELCLNQVLDWSLGRVYASDIINGGYTPTAEDLEQIKTVYDEEVKPEKVFYIRINPGDKKKIAQAIYDKLRLDMKQRQFNNDMELQLVLEHAERWFNGIAKSADQKQNVGVIKRQVELCLRKIDEVNKDEHKPFCNFNNEPLDDDNIVAGLDCYGYSAQPYYRLNDDKYSAMIEAFDKWSSAHYGKDGSSEIEQKPFTPLSDGIDEYLHDMQNSMIDEKIIEQMSFHEFVNSIYCANFRTMYEAAKKTRNIKRFYLIVQRIKTWFPSEWEEQAASSMGVIVKAIRNITLSEIKAAHPKWYKDLDNTFPKNNSTQ